MHRRNGRRQVLTGGIVGGIIVSGCIVGGCLYDSTQFHPGFAPHGQHRLGNRILNKCRALNGLDQHDCRRVRHVRFTETANRDTPDKSVVECDARLFRNTCPVGKGPPHHVFLVLFAQGLEELCVTRNTCFARFRTQCDNHSVGLLFPTRFRAATLTAI